MVTALACAFALSAVISAVLAAVHRWGRRRSPLSGVNAFMAAGVAVLSVLNLVHLLARDPAVVWPVAAASPLVSAVVVASVFCLSKIVANRAWRVSRRAVLALAVHPVAELLLLATNPRHRLFFTGLDPAGLGGTLVAVPGPAAWGGAAYVYALLSVSLLLVIRARLRAPRGRRQLYGWTLAAFAPPILVNAVGMSLPVRTVDLTAIGLGVTVLIAYGALVRSLPEQIQVGHGQIFDSLIDAVAVIDRSGRFLTLNAACRDLLRKAVPDLPEEPAGLPLTDVLGPDFVLTEDSGTEQILVDVLGRGVDMRVRISVLRDRRGECIGWALVGHDITELNRRRREAEETAVRLREQLRTIEALRADLAEQAARDSLTGLHNRRHLAEALEREAARAAEEGTPLSLAIIDVDHFKRVNDTYGHGGGDTVLVHLARLLAGAVRQGDVVARYGGEEFVLLLPGVAEEPAWRLVERLHERVGRTVIDVDGRSLTVTFSAGVAGLAPGGSTEDLLRAADAALYEAKRHGRDRVERSLPAPAGGPAAPPDDHRPGPADLATGEAA
ncbi:diguanylate cyclase [Planomonospora algeriensis]